MTNILVIDIESAPKLAYVWKYYKENVGAKQVLDHGYIMSFAAGWLAPNGTLKNLVYAENRKVDDTEIVRLLIGFLDQADIVIAHNAKKFDLPTISARALVAGIKPPSPYKVIDTLEVAKREFRFEANSLEYLAMVLNCTNQKGGHKKYPGFELWLECMRGNDDAWNELKYYNQQDVIVLAEVYRKMRPWMRNHPNILVNDFWDGVDDGACPKCGSHNVQKRGFYTTNVSKYQRYRCNDCGGWHRSRHTILKRGANRGLAINAI